jgi:hypothetical protein
MERIWLKRLLLGDFIVVGVAAAFQFASVWFKNRLPYGPEQQLDHVISSNVTQLTYFSLKYEGLYPWWPANLKPHFSVTVVDAKSGRLVQRETDFDWPKTKPTAQPATLSPILCTLIHLGQIFDFSQAIIARS